MLKGCQLMEIQRVVVIFTLDVSLIRAKMYRKLILIIDVLMETLTFNIDLYTIFRIKGNHLIFISRLMIEIFWKQMIFYVSVLSIYNSLFKIVVRSKAKWLLIEISTKDFSKVMGFKSLSLNIKKRISFGWH